MHMRFSYHVRNYLYIYKGISVRKYDILNVISSKYFLVLYPCNLISHFF